MRAFRIWLFFALLFAAVARRRAPNGGRRRPTTSSSFRKARRGKRAISPRSSSASTCRCARCRISSLPRSPRTPAADGLTASATSAISGASAGQGVAGFYIPRAGGSVAFVPAREEIEEQHQEHRGAQPARFANRAVPRICPPFHVPALLRRPTPAGTSKASPKPIRPSTSSPTAASTSATPRKRRAEA